MKKQQPKVRRESPEDFWRKFLIWKKAKPGRENFTAKAYGLVRKNDK